MPTQLVKKSKKTTIYSDPSDVSQNILEANIMRTVRRYETSPLETKTMMTWMSNTKRFSQHIIKNRAMSLLWANPILDLIPQKFT